MENGDIGSQPFVEPVRLDTKFNIFDTFWLERGERSLPKIEPARHISAACLGIGKYVVRPLEIEAQRIGWIIEIGGLILIATDTIVPVFRRSEEHTSELQSLMRISYAVFCLKKKTKDDIQ